PIVLKSGRTPACPLAAMILRPRVSTLAATAVEGGAKEARARVGGACSFGNGLGATTAVCDSGPIHPDTASVIMQSIPGIRMAGLHPTSELDGGRTIARPQETVQSRQFISGRHAKRPWRLSCKCQIT